MKLKLASSLSAAASEALEDLVAPLYSKPGMRILAITEWKHIERNDVAPDEDKEPSVTIGVKHIEVARGEQVEHVRKALRALHVQRTARGTLDEQLGELKLNASVIEELGDDLALRETARLRAAMKHTADTVNRLRIGQFSEQELRKQLDKLHAILDSTLSWTEDEAMA